MGRRFALAQTFGVRHHRRFVVASRHHRQSVQLDVGRERPSAIYTYGGELASAVHADPERIERGYIRRGIARRHAILKQRIVQRILVGLGMAWIMSDWVVAWRVDDSVCNCCALAVTSTADSRVPTLRATSTLIVWPVSRLTPVARYTANPVALTETV